MSETRSTLPRKWGRPVLTPEQQQRCHRFVWGSLMRESHDATGSHYTYPGISRKQYFESYQSWALGGNAWDALGEGGTGIMAVLCWYQHIHKPGSKEWRPSIILEVLLQSASTRRPAETGDAHG